MIDADDKLQSVVWATGSKSLTYDGAGRHKTMSATGLNLTTYDWDYESRLTSITRPGTTTSAFGYNGLDTRISKVDASGTASYKRDGVGVTAPVLSDGSAVYTPGISERRGSTTTFEHSGVKSLEAQSGTAQASVDLPTTTW